MSRILANIGLSGDYDVGEDDWGLEMDANLLKLSVLVQGRAAGILAAEPEPPTADMVVILDEDHLTHPNAVAVYDEGDWVYFDPEEGWWFFDTVANTYVSFDGAIWADFASSGGGISDAPIDGTAYVRKDGGWVAETVGSAPTETLIVAVGDETTAIIAGVAKVTFRMPYAFTLTAVRASLTTASSSGTPTVDINEAGATILSTKLTIDSGEKTSTTAAAAAVISDGALADDAEITIDIDTAGTGAAGLKVYLIGHQ